MGGIIVVAATTTTIDGTILPLFNILKGDGKHERQQPWLNLMQL